MPAITTLLPIIAITRIAGPGAGGLTLASGLIMSVRGLWILLCTVASILSLVALEGIWIIYCFATGGILLLSCLAFREAMGSARRSYDMLERKRIGTDDLYEDKYGRTWRKVAGVFRITSDGAGERAGNSATQLDGTVSPCEKR